ncbi:MAG: YihA family ribosome biogenesis GTP-binding protein [Bacteroidales bacterium]|nr:YihA family ribosome biogenesis GTP-binding protein [Bacteroidales bacterium]
MKISKAVYVASSVSASGRPSPSKREFAFIGRSNVGKSSLINCLTGNSSLAHTSSKPGKTQCINHFLINDSWYLVDLPGYGFAKMSKERRDALAGMIADYIDNSADLVLLFVLLDSRHDLMKIDLDFLISLGEKGVPFAIVLTKCDKLGTNALAARIEKMKAAVGEYWEPLPDIFATSSEKGTGKEDVLNYIEQVLKDLDNNNQ